MKKQLLCILVLAVACTTCYAQTLWEEDFESYTDGTGIRGIDGTQVGDFAHLPFTIDASDTSFNDTNGQNDYIQIDGTLEFELQMRDLDGEAIVTFNEIDISSETGTVTVSFSDVDFNITSSSSAWSTDVDEYIDIYYSLDGGNSYTRIPNHMSNGNADHTFIAPPTPTGTDRNGVDFNYSLSEIIDPGAATSIIIQIRAENGGSNEEFEFDDLIISRGGTELYNEPFQSFDNGGTPQDFATPTGLVGTGSEGNTDTTSGVTKWSISGMLENSNDFAEVIDNSANTTKAFKFEDVNDPATLETESIDISGETEITFGFDINFDDSTHENDDYIDVLYSIDGGAFTLAQEDGTSGHTYSGDGNITTFVNTDDRDQQFSMTLSGLTATSLVIRIVAVSDSASEDYEIDNIKVVAGNTLSTHSSELSTNLSMYPNPTINKELNIKFASNTSAIIAIYDIAGRNVFNTITKNTSVTTLNLNHLQSGLYLVKINEYNNPITKKVMLR